MGSHGLELYPSKSKAVMLTKRALPSVLRLGEETIPVSRAQKYMGVELDSHLTFRRHIEGAAAGALRVANSISRLMLCLGGSSWAKRRLLMSVANIKLLFSAQI